MKRVLVLGCCLVFSAALGCSPADDDDDDQQQDGSLTVEKFADELSKAGCNQAVCGGWQSPSTCVPANNNVGLDEVKRSVAAGRVSFDAKAAAKCVELFKSVNSATCWGASASFDESAFGRDCEPVFKGLVANGGTCYATEECADGTCSFPGDACPGTCAAFRTVGQSCGSDGLECAEGLDCAGDDVCVALAGVGESCAEVSCADGLVCDMNDECVSVAAPAAVGADCDDARPCASGLYCNQPDWPEAGKCAEKAATGGDCLYRSDCRGRQICAGASYGMDGQLPGKCALPQDVGGPCVPTAEDVWYTESGCYGVLLCDAATSKCVTAPKAGQACVDSECADGAYCNDEDQCVAQKANGETCEFYEECQSWNCSDEGVCVADPSDGGECVAP